MKTEVSIPDDLFALTEIEMEKCGVSRDEVIEDALRMYLSVRQPDWGSMSEDEITAAMNRFL